MKDLPKAVIFDIDGTIADTSPRMHLIKPPEGEKKNWGKFFRDSANDKRFEHAKTVYDALLNLGGAHSIFFVTARPENNRKVTEQWLEDNGFGYYNRLFMRPDTERKPDFEVKRDIYHEHFKGKYDLGMVFEDRLHVAKMWRDLGIPVFLCGDHWQDNDWSK